MVATDGIVDELNELRRGRGLQADNLHLLALPNLRAVCGIGDTDSPCVVRQKFVLRLTEACGHLAGDLRAAALAALALHEEAHHRFLHQRMDWFTSQIDRSSLRTARRWVDTAFRRLALELSDEAEGDDAKPGKTVSTSWYTEKLTSVLDMSVDPPELIETRQIVAATDELDEIILLMSAPKGIELNDEEVVTAKIELGGHIVETDYEPSGHSQFVMRLPKPLSLGERHTYSVRFTSYRRMWMKPYYVLLPLRAVENFTMYVRFPPDKLPDQMWRLTGVPPVVLDGGRPNEDTLVLNNAGEVKLEFFALQQGLAYGAAWKNIKSDEEDR